ncbi:hypothetical protein [Alishewanella jeotgali]|uniref:Fe2OG dioxygenase domain-containing protein n=1 Tax=Alishewanella jeotgali KCTC 22429 TaxID=1129374 RepID=H3ZB93_9ALTE|nr:hypothetical protein [Alishewanella jeotgali]EHR42207.1 hypothetical protein AJE_02991 [Alishewanella jeotgali KCTC 22429]
MKNRLSILSNASKADIFSEPYPHIIIKNALDPTVFKRLADEYPDPAIVLNGREKKDTWYDYPACSALQNNNISPIWQEFLAYHTSSAFYQELLQLFGDIIKQWHPQLEQTFGKRLEDFSISMRQNGAADNPKNYLSDVSLECQFYVNYTEQSKAVRGPHVDRPTELFAALLYFRQDDDDSIGSNLDVCQAIDPAHVHPGKKILVDHLPMEVEPKKVSVVRTAEYEANTLVLFINSEKSIHAVSPRTATKTPRKHINFTADLFSLNDKGLFKVVHRTDKRLKNWLADKPVIWRLAKFISN